MRAPHRVVKRTLKIERLTNNPNLLLMQNTKRWIYGKSKWFCSECDKPCDVHDSTCPNCGVKFDRSFISEVRLHEN